MPDVILSRHWLPSLDWRREGFHPLRLIIATPAAFGYFSLRLFSTAPRALFAAWSSYAMTIFTPVIIDWLMFTTSLIAEYYAG